MPKKNYLLALLLIISAFAFSQEKLPANMFRKKLPNGLEMLVVEDHTVPLATVILTFKAGSFTETDDINGLTSLYMFMLSCGNKYYINQQDLSYHAGGLGMQLRNETVNYESSSIYFTLPAINLTSGLDFLNEEVRHAKMDANELDLMKGSTLNGIKRKQSNPYYILSDSINSRLWGSMYSRKRPNGNFAVMAAATPASLDVIKQRYMYPNNAIMIVGGDVSHEVVFSEIEKLYGDWAPSSFDPALKWPVPEFEPLKESKYTIIQSALAHNPYIEILWQGPDTRKDIQGTYTADMFSFILDQNSSKITKALVQSGLATSVGVSYLTNKYTGSISLNVVPIPGKIKECMDEVKKQIDMMDADDYFTAEQIETARRMLAIKNERQEDITTSYMQTLSFWWAVASINYKLNYSDNINKVTKAEIKQYVDRYIKNKPYSAGLLLSPELREQSNADSFFK